MTGLRAAIDEVAETSAFTGVVRVDRGDSIDAEAAYGLADRAHGIPLTPEHQLGTASVTKGFTALTVLSLVADGALSLGTAARSVLGRDLPLIDDGVTVEHLLSHRSGIGDYLDESTIVSSDDYLMPVPVHRLARSDDYLAILDGHPQVTQPGSEFAYCNGAFVVLAVIAERVGGKPFADLVEERVWGPAGMVGTAFLCSDELPASAAVGYLYRDGLRSNVLHLPVRGSGDGGAYTTVADMARFWLALLGGRIVPERWLAEMLSPRLLPSPDGLGYGLGVWLRDGGVLELHGYDAGVSYLSMHDPASSSTWTVGSTTGDGIGLLGRLLVDDVRRSVGRGA